MFIDSQSELCGAVLKQNIAGCVFIPAHQILFDLLLEWPHLDRKIDFVWAKTQLEKSGSLKEVGEKEGLNEYWEFIPTHLNACSYIETVAEKYKLRRCKLFFERLATHCQDRLPERTSGPILAEANEELSRIFAPQWRG